MFLSPWLFGAIILNFFLLRVMVIDNGKSSNLKEPQAVFLLVIVFTIALSLAAIDHINENSRWVFIPRIN
jgi:hypothetical protein